MLLACVALINADSTVHPDELAGMSAERKTREDCKFEYGASEGCEACCKKFHLHKWDVRYKPNECKCHHLPQPPQLPERDYDRFNRKTNEEKMASLYASRGFM